MQNDATIKFSADDYDLSNYRSIIDKTKGLARGRNLVSMDFGDSCKESGPCQHDDVKLNWDNGTSSDFPGSFGDDIAAILLTFGLPVPIHFVVYIGPGPFVGMGSGGITLKETLSRGVVIHRMKNPVGCPDCVLCETCLEKKLRAQYMPTDDHSQKQGSSKIKRLEEQLRERECEITALEEQNRKNTGNKQVYEKLEDMAVRLTRYIRKTGGSLAEALGDTQESQ